MRYNMQVNTNLRRIEKVSHVDKHNLAGTDKVTHVGKHTFNKH